MLEELKKRLAQGLALAAQGAEIVEAVRMDVAEAKHALSTTDIAELDRMLDEATDRTLALNKRIQDA
jgi:hypothetical protein